MLDLGKAGEVREGLHKGLRIDDEVRCEKRTKHILRIAEVIPRCDYYTLWIIITPGVGDTRASVTAGKSSKNACNNHYVDGYNVEGQSVMM